MTASLRDSKARLSELVERAAGGERVLITVRGRPKAQLMAVEKMGNTLDMAAWAEELAALQDRYSHPPEEASSVFFRMGSSSRGSVVVAAYWDTSCVLKLYCRKVGSPACLARAGAMKEPIISSVLTVSEMAIAFHQKEMRGEIERDSGLFQKFEEDVLRGTLHPPSFRQRCRNQVAKDCRHLLFQQPCGAVAHP